MFSLKTDSLSLHLKQQNISQTRWKKLLGWLLLALLFLMCLNLQAALRVLRAAASGVEGVNFHQLDWVCVLGSVRGYVFSLALQVTFAVVMVTLSFVCKEMFYVCDTQINHPCTDLKTKYIFLPPWTLWLSSLSIPVLLFLIFITLF